MSAILQSRTAVLIFYAGRSHQFDYNPHEQVTALLVRAEDFFGITANRHLMGLFTEAGQELPDHSSLESAGLEPGAKLVLRQSAVRGG